MLFRDTNVVDLSTGTINRLLRPLRNKCATLTAFTSTTCIPTTHAIVTYSSRASSLYNGQAPLPSLLPLEPPNAIGARIHFDKYRVESLELSRKIYAVRDCFREVVLKTEGRKGSSIRDSSSVMSLASMCSTIVGESMQSGSNDKDDVDDTDIINQLYEIVPLQYRRWTVVAHALSIVLNLGPRHPTLLSIILDVCLSHHLFHESGLVLRNLISVAASTTSSSIPRISQPAHSTFLLDLREKWNTAGRSDQGFVNHLIQVLDGVQDQDAWASKALKKLAFAIAKTDLPSLARLASSCVQSIARRQFSRQYSKRKTEKEMACSPHSRLQNQLHDWIYLVSDGAQLNDTNEEYCQSAFELLHSLFVATYHTLPPQDIGIDISSAVICLATQWLSISDAVGSHSQVASIVYRLHQIKPQTLTFNKLLANVLTPHFASTDIAKLDYCRETLLHYATTLRSHGLLRFEASLWACALRHIELPDSERLLAAGGCTEKVRKYRQQLIEFVDDAEKRCFGVDGESNKYCPLSDDCFSDLFAPRIAKSLDQCDWQWEEMIGGWVRPTPKRRKIGSISQQSPSLRVWGQSHNKSRSAFSSTTNVISKPIRPRRVSNAMPLTRNKCTSTAMRDDVFPEDLTVSDDTKSNFTSLLSVAFSQRTVLHSNKHHFCESRGHGKTSSSRSDPIETLEGNESPTSEFLCGHPSSDDSLDLFTHVSSSPLCVK